MIRESMREINKENFNALYCFECDYHFCVDKERKKPKNIRCPYCGKKFRLQTTYTEVC